MAGWRFALLGVVTEFVPSPLRKAKLRLEENNKREAVIALENTGIAKVVPVDYLLEILFSDELEDLRSQQIEQRLKKNAQGG